MKIGVFGTGMVGKTIATRLAGLGHEVKMGSRTADNAKAAEWVAATGGTASQGTFADAAAFGEILINCTKGDATLNVLELAGAEHMAGKVLVDISNPLDASKGMPPTLFISNTDSLGEAVQRAYPGVRVVKTLNTMNCNLMANPALLAGDHSVFLSGNDGGAKSDVKKLLASFGWPEKNMIDLGDITTARGPEQLLPLWIRLWGAFGTPNFNFNIVK